MSVAADVAGTSGDEQRPLRRNRDFLLLWTGAGVSTLGMRAAAAAYPLLLVWRNGDTTGAGAVGFAALLPQLVVQIPAGALVDRVPRRSLMMCCDLAGMLSMLGVVLALATGHLWLPQIMVAAFIEGTAAIIYRLAERAAIRHVVPGEQLAAALSQNEARGQASGLMGGPLGSGLFAVLRWLPFGMTALCHLVALLLLMLIRGSLEERRTATDLAVKTSVRREIGEGLRWAWRDKVLRVAIALTAGSNIVFQILAIGIVLIVERNHDSPALVGVISLIGGLGGVGGALAARKLLGLLGMPLLFISVFFVWAAFLAGIASTSEVVILGILFGAMVSAGAVMNVTAGIYQLKTTPDYLQGRVGSVLGLAASGMNSIGSLVGGFALHLYGIRATFLVSAAAMAVFGLIAAASPAIRRADPDRAAGSAGSDGLVQTGRRSTRKRKREMETTDWAPHEIPVDGIDGVRKFILGTDLKTELAARKALIFRGVDASQETLPEVLDLLLPNRLAYVHGNSPRTKIGQNIYTSTEYPAEHVISMHSEMSYTSPYPDRLAFYCEVPAGSGGATPVVDAAQWLADLDDDLVDDFSGGICYTQNLHSGIGLGKSWQATFETEDRDAIRVFLDKTGAAYEWRDDGSLRISVVRPAIARHPVTGAEVWFNQADQWHPVGLGPAGAALANILPEDEHPQSVRFADGRPIPDEYIRQIMDRGLARAVDVQWRRGDLLLIDNMLTAHGRRPYTGERRILVAMS